MKSNFTCEGSDFGCLILGFLQVLILGPIEALFRVFGLDFGWQVGK